MQGSSKRILVIEDDIDIRDALVELLNMEGFTVEAVENGREGLESLRRADTSPDLILVDLMMPVMDGHQFLREKGADPRLRPIPTIVMSADSTFHKNPDILSATVALARKPIDVDQFIQTLRQVTTRA